MPDEPSSVLKPTGSARRLWRAAALVLLVVALSGPWAFDLTNVPAQYPCGPPSIRLEGDFCGYPLAGLWILGTAGSSLIHIVRELVATGSPSGSLTGVALYILFALFLVLPFFTTLALLRVGERPGLRRIHLLAWGIAGVLGLLVGFAGTWRYSWSQWGAWLYSALAVGVLVLELAASRLNTKTSTRLSHFPLETTHAPQSLQAGTLFCAV